MKKMAIFFLTLAIASLACLSAAEPFATYPPDPTAAPIGETESPAGAVYEIPTIVETRTSKICAVVIADQSLHLRQGPSSDDIVLTWLNHGDVVQVISNSDPNWTLVQYQDFLGYVRAIYLQESECVE